MYMDSASLVKGGSIGCDLRVPTSARLHTGVEVKRRGSAEWKEIAMCENRRTTEYKVGHAAVDGGAFAVSCLASYPSDVPPLSCRRPVVVQAAGHAACRPSSLRPHRSQPAEQYVPSQQGPLPWHVHQPRGPLPGYAMRVAGPSM